MAQDQQIEHFISPEDEIRFLEQKLEERKKEIQKEGGQVDKEKDLFREILREHIQRSKGKPVSVPAVPLASVPPTLAKPTDGTQKKEREEQVRNLVDFALQNSIQKAVRMAEDANPYFLDELHDHLVDDYYEKLVALRKIKVL